MSATTTIKNALSPLEATALGCCGIKELTGISQLVDECKDPFDVIKSVREKFIGDPKNPDPSRRLYTFGRCAFVIFSQATVKNPTQSQQYGQRLANYIEKHNLGQVTVSEPRVNPNSMNLVTVFVWALDAPAIIKHCS